jgi:lipopolysaccharide/colanic/teichoic acid biosynthesis glycosyltransferase
MTQPARDPYARCHTPMTRLVTEKSDLRELSHTTTETCRSSYRHSSELLTQDIFQRFLCWERKRAERSGKCVLLMLLNAEKLLVTKQLNRVLATIVSALSSPTRETDILGWYERNAVLGIIFTELHKSDRDRLQNLMSAEVSARLRMNLNQEQADQIRISFHSFPEDGDKTNGSPSIDKTIYPDLREPNLATRLSRLAKRALDVVVSLIAIILFSPLFILISVAVKLTSKGPILFRQERVGQYGRRFSFLKFRSMQCGSDSHIHQEYVKQFISGTIAKEQGLTYKITQDPRLTRIGWFLRKSSLDELPQLINVLKGEMSLVGPRPAIPYEIDFYQMWHRARFLEVKPGITGLWQVTGRSKTTFDDMVRLDLRYVKQWSFWLDIKILLHTPQAVFSGEGAY